MWLLDNEKPAPRELHGTGAGTWRRCASMAGRWTEHFDVDGCLDLLGQRDDVERAGGCRGVIDEVRHGASGMPSLYALLASFR